MSKTTTLTCDKCDATTTRKTESWARVCFFKISEIGLDEEEYCRAAADLCPTCATVMLASLGLPKPATKSDR